MHVNALPSSCVPRPGRAQVVTMAANLSKVNIKEANEHLKQLHQRVFELENQIQLQAIHVEELQKTNTELQQKVHEVMKEKEEALRVKDSLIVDLGQKLEESEKRVQTLLEAAEERDETLVKLEGKARLFYEVVEHRHALTRIVQVLEELSSEQEEMGTSNGEMSGSDGVNRTQNHLSEDGTNLNTSDGSATRR